MMEIRFLSLANREVDDAVQWYETREEGLSREFLDELDRVVRLVRLYPIRACRLSRKSDGSSSHAFLILSFTALMKEQLS